jgi:type III secretory pathway component EscU
MKERILKLLKLDNLFDNLSGYFESKIELLKFEVKEEVVLLLARVLVILLIAICFTFFLLLASLGLAYYLGTLVGMAGGLLIVAGFYILVTVMLLGFREQISDGIQGMVMDKSQKNKGNKDEAGGNE